MITFPKENKLLVIDLMLVVQNNDRNIDLEKLQTDYLIISEAMIESIL